MRIEMHLLTDTDPLLFEDKMAEAAHASGYGLRKRFGEMVNFQSSIVVETALISGRNLKYIAISAEVYKIPERTT